MRNFKIFQIISVFSKDELKEFEYFIKSPYLTSSRDYNSILKTIYTFIGNPDKLKSISNEEFYAEIFPGKKYSNKTLRNRLNEMTVLAKKFIIQKTLEKDKQQNDYMLLKGFKERKLYGLFRNEYTRIEEAIDKRSSKSYISAETKMLSTFVYLENHDYTKTFEGYKKSSDYMLTYFLENYLIMMIEFESEKQYGINTDRNIAYDLINNFKTENFIKTLEERNDDNYLIIFLYYYLYKSIHNLNDEVSYKKYSDLFFGNLNKFSYEQKDTFFGYMISRYFMLSNRGKTDVYEEVFKIYDTKLKLGLHSELKAVRYPSTAFRDYIVVGLKLKKYKWVENFIKNYSQELPQETRDEEMKMAYARLYLFKEEYDYALQYLNEMKTTNYIYLLDASRIKLRVFYEKSYFEEAFLEIDRIKHYIKNNTKKIPLSVRKYSKEFLDVYLSLTKVRLNPDKKEIDFLLKTIQSTSTLVSKDWFTIKVKEMKFESKS